MNDTVDMTEILGENELSELIAAQFLTSMRTIVGADAYADICHRNITEKRSIADCASYDYCDAEAVMMHAFEIIAERPCRAYQDDAVDIGRMIAAWEYAFVLMARS